MIAMQSLVSVLTSFNFLKNLTLAIKNSCHIVKEVVY